jgi:hypothetical protein
VAAVEFQIVDILRVVAPPPRLATPAAPGPAVEPGQAAPVVGTFETSFVGYHHVQAVGIQDIRTLVPIILSITSTQYPRWLDLVLLTLQRYALDDHISSSAPTLDDLHWRWMDNVILSWLLGTITVDLQKTTHACDRTTHQLWFALEEQFLSNCEVRTLHFDTQLWLFVQGDLSIDDYCHRMKQMTDDLSEHVVDRILVLQILLLTTKIDRIAILLAKLVRPVS